MTTLGTWGSAYDINNSGVVSGNQGSWAYLWDGTTAIELNGQFWGDKRALGINDAGVAVGYNEDSDTYVSTAWVASGPDAMQDLNLLLTYSSAYASPGSLAVALSINNSGQILAHNGTNYFLLTPSAEPPGPQNPTAPSYVSAYGWHGMVELYWPGVYFAESHNVKRSTVSGGPYTTIATDVPGNGFTDTSVVNGIQYFYVVSSVSGSYESADSSEASALPVGQPVNLPEAPASVSASAANGVAYLNWAAGNYAASYNVKRSTANGGPYITIATGVLDLGFTDNSVVNGTRYYYVVSSVNGEHESANSAEVSAKPLAAPAAPTNLTATAVKGGRSVSLAWQQSTSLEIQFNRIYRSLNGGAFTQVAQINSGTGYVDTNVKRNSTYSYKVTAINVNGQESPYSNAVSVRPK